MSTRLVLLDTGFVAALTEEQAPFHADAAELYRTLIHTYVTGADRMFALSTALALLPNDVRKGVLAPVQTLYVSRQHRSASRRVDAQVSPDIALTLAVLSREKMRTVVTLGSREGGSDYDDFDLEVVTVAHSG